MEKATFAAGCFWGVEAVFRQVEGVSSTAVGCTGGSTRNPSYRDVCSGRTGHAEAVQVEYDPSTVTYARLLSVFWENHNPTTRNRQGPDIGDQYRSSIFFHTPSRRLRRPHRRKTCRDPAGTAKASSPRLCWRRSSTSRRITTSSIWRSKDWLTAPYSCDAVARVTGGILTPAILLLRRKYVREGPS